MRLKGNVSSIVDFGAFVDLGGIDGLVHISELSWNHVNHPSEVVKVGDEVEVEVLDVDLQRERISLGLKQTTRRSVDPAGGELPRGYRSLTARSPRSFPLALSSSWATPSRALCTSPRWRGRHIDTPAQVVPWRATIVKVKVMEINPERRRISLSMKAAAEPSSASRSTWTSRCRPRRSRPAAEKDEAVAEAEVVVESVETVEE